MNRMLLWATLPTGLALAACDGSGSAVPADALTVTADTATSGTIVVTSRGEAPEWRLEEVSSVDAPGVDVVSLAYDRTDGIWVADAASQQIRVFGPEGNLIRLIGRAGSGEGAYSDLRSIAFLGSGLVALDAGNDRIAEISLSGSWRGERPSPFAGSGPAPARRLVPIGPAEVYEWSVREGDAGPEPVWVRHGIRAGEETRSALDPAEGGARLTCLAAGSSVSYPAPFQPRYVEHPAADGLVAMAWTGEYRIAFVNRAGDTVRVVARERPVTPLTDEAWAAERAALSRAIPPGASCEPAEPDRPASAPPIHDLLIDVAGRLLVEAETPSGRVWDVYDLTGYPLGTFPAFERDGTVPPYVTTEGIAWVATNGQGEPTITLSRIVR